MNLEMIDIVNVLSTPLRLNAKAGERIVILTDTRMEPELWQGMATAARMLDMEATVAIMTPRAAHGHDPDPALMAAALDPATDLAIYMTSTALAHAPMTQEMIARGKRFILMEELKTSMLGQDGPATADYPAMDVLGQKLAAIMSDGQTMRVTCPNGTDLTASIDGRPGRSIAGRHFPMDLETGGGGCAFPDGECHVCPVEGTGEGRVVFDLTAHSVGALKEPLILTIEKGWVTRIEGGQGADIWNRVLQTHGDRGSYNAPAEISIGLNPKVIPAGVMRTDKKMYGTVHVGIGDTVSLGGTCHAKLRLEGVIRFPEVSVDGQTLTRGGRILID